MTTQPWSGHYRTDAASRHSTAATTAATTVTTTTVTATASHRHRHHHHNYHHSRRHSHHHPHHHQVDASTKSTVQMLPLLSSTAGPRDGEGALSMPCAGCLVPCELSALPCSRSQSGSRA